MIRNDKRTSESECEVLRRALKNVRDEDIEVFLHHNPEVAIQIVNDLIDEPTVSQQSAANPSSRQFGSNNHNSSSS